MQRQLSTGFLTSFERWGIGLDQRLYDFDGGFIFACVMQRRDFGGVRSSDLDFHGLARLVGIETTAEGGGLPVFVLGDEEGKVGGFCKEANVIGVVNVG